MIEIFERAFSWAMRNGPRLLFAAAIALLAIGAVFFTWSLVQWAGSASSYTLSASIIATLIYSHFVPAAYLLFGAILTDRLQTR